jgi:predicted ATP-dependent endonuclease of OLD family
MQLKGFRVQMYKGVIDSGWIDVESLTVLVGKNESGKTTLLKALHKLNPFSPEPYVMAREWPRGHRRERSDAQVVCTARFELSEDEVQTLRTMTDQQVDLKSSIVLTRDYAGRLEVEFSEGVFPNKLHPTDVDRPLTSLPQINSAVLGAPFAERATSLQEEARRLAREGRFSDLGQLQQPHQAALQQVLNQGDQNQQNQQQQYISQYTAKLSEVAQLLANTPSIQKRAHEYVVKRLPTFIYMDDFKSFTGTAMLNQVKQRRDAKSMTPEDSTFQMILKLSALSLDDLCTAADQPDREQRQYDLDDGAKTLTNLIRERLKQRQYQVEFRADGHQFFTMVTDHMNEALIRLEERSKGFQWFFSFDLMFMHESKGTFKDCVILLDEPGLHLHPGAQKDLLERLEEYAAGNTLIYTTHLPFMLDLRHPDRIRVISETDLGAVVTNDLTQSQPEAKLTLQAAMGMSGSQSYLVAQRNLVVEGVDDYWILSELSNLMIRSGEVGLPEDILVTPAGGASEAAYIATFMVGQKLDVVVLLDSDQAGDNARDALVKKWLTRYNGKESQVLSLGTAVGATGEFSIEDVFPEDYYMTHVKQVYAKAIATAGAEPKLQVGNQLCKRVERSFEDLGLKFNKGSVAKVLRSELSRMKNVSDLPAGMKKTAAAVIRTIRSSFDALTPSR